MFQNSNIQLSAEDDFIACLAKLKNQYSDLQIKNIDTNYYINCHDPAAFYYSYTKFYFTVECTATDYVAFIYSAYFDTVSERDTEFNKVVEYSVANLKYEPKK